MPVKIRACDTMGYGVPYSERGAAPQRARHHLRPAALFATCPAEMLEWHGHNDFYKAVTNASTRLALRLASAVNCSPARASASAPAMCPLEAMVFEYDLLPPLARWTAWTPRSITEIADYFQKGHRLRDPRP